MSLQFSIRMNQTAINSNLSRSSPKATIIANCQGEPFAEILRLFFGFEILLTVKAHRLDLLNEQKLNHAIDASDFILSQEIQSNFPCELIRSEVARARCPKKFLLWQNLYFGGYNPELFYLRAEPGRPYRGPLGDYHIKDIADGYKDGLSTEQVTALIRNPEVNRERYAAKVQGSIEELKNREKSTLTPISDFVAENFRKRRLFFTFNHPANELLFRVAHLLAKELGVRPLERFRNNILNERLNDILLPINPGIRDQMAPTVSDWDSYTGFRYSFNEGGQVILGKERRFYKTDELVNHFYHTYKGIGLSHPRSNPIDEKP